MQSSPTLHLSDAELQQQVLAELDWDPTLNAADVGVTVKKGVVTLKGTVRSYEEKLRAEKVVRRMQGVLALADDLRVKLPGSASRTDGDLARAVVDSLWERLMEASGGVQVTVEHGLVTLGGTVPYLYQKISAEHTVSHLTGVTRVVNRIVVTPPVTPVGIKTKIVQALERHALTDAQRINVAVEGSIVTLTGTARSLAERADAANAARLALGVTKVNNLITVSWS